MYYHVRVMAGGPGNRFPTQLQYDVTKEELIGSYILPLQKNEIFFINGHPVDPVRYAPRRIEVWATETTALEFGAQHPDEAKALTDANPNQTDFRFLITTLANDVTNEVFREASKPIPAVQKSMDTEKVFIVHGRDRTTLAEIARFVTDIGLKPIILSEQVNQGAAIIDKFEKFSDVGFAIVLLTPDDKGGLRSSAESELELRARQNVIFEMGYLMAKLGRSRVAPIVASGMTNPTDIDGITYIPMDQENSWHRKVAKEMVASGLAVDALKALMV